MSEQLLAQAHACRVGGDYAAAIPLYEQLVSENPDLSEAWWGLAHATMNGLGDFDLAIERFVKACELDPSSQLYLYDLAMMHTMLGDDERAKPLFEQCLAIDAATEIASKARNQLRYYQ